MKTTQLLLLIMLLSITTIQTTQVCQCKSQGLPYYNKDCSKCDNSCQKVSCYKYKYAASDYMNDPFLNPMLFCSSSQSYNEDKWYILSPDSLCDKPQVYFACFKGFPDYYGKLLLKNQSCRSYYEYKLECFEQFGSSFCKTTEEIRTKFDYKDATFRMYQPLTFDHFDLSGVIYFDDQVNKEYDYFERIQDISKNKNIINIDELKIIASHAFHTYEPNTKTTLEGVKTIQNESKNIFVEVGWDNTLKSIVIAFRGTTFKDSDGNIDLNNIMNDINLSLVSTNLCSDCKVHSGFSTSYESIDYQLKETLRKYFIGSYYGGLIFTGHSYGGALASLASMKLFNTPSFSKSSIITFGKPRVGNEEYTKFFNSSIFGKNYRVTFKNDPVVNVPLKSQSYLHEGTEIHFSEAEFSYVIGELNKDSNSDSFNPLNISDHSGYVFLNREKEFIKSR